MKKYVFESLKFFCAAILCTILFAFATPSWAGCNLFDGTITHWAYTLNPNRVNVSPSYMGITLPVTENKTYTFSRATAVGNRFVRYFTADVPVEDMAVYDVNPNIPIDTLTHTFTVPAGMKYVVFYFDVSGADISNSKMQLEEGTTATAYTPYNPQCATCDGTVVNYVSATGTVTQSPDPTPEHPVTPVFYQQGNMILRAVGDYKDSYDATTGKITRRVGVKVLDGSEGFSLYVNRYVSNILDGTAKDAGKIISSHFEEGTNGVRLGSGNGKLEIFQTAIPDLSTAGQLRNWLAEQYAAGTPVMLYYLLATETTEDWTETSYCETPIKIATTKYNETAFSPLNTALQNAISVVDTVVSNTITQAGRIATLQAQKQTRPNDIADDSEKCPAGKKCLLVEDASGIPHWYEICSSAHCLPGGYTELQWIESTGTQYIDTGVVPNQDSRMTIDVLAPALGSGVFSFGGSFNQAWRPGFGVYGGNTTYKASLVYNNSDTAFEPNTQLQANVRYVFDLNKNVSTLQANGSTIASFTVNAETFSLTSSIELFRVNIAEPRYGKFRLYSAKIYNNGTLVRDFIPAKNSSGVVGMYDTVEGRFFTNAGTGEFVAGDPVVE